MTITQNLIASDVQQQELDALVGLFELSLPNNAGTAYFTPTSGHQSSDATTYTSIQFRSKDGGTTNTYVSFPIQLDGFEMRTEGATNRPVLTIANLGQQLITALGGNITSYNDLIGQTLVYRQTFKKYLVGQASAGTGVPTELPSVSYKVSRVQAETPTFVSFELAVVYDLEGIKIPRRIVTGKFCSWQYQSEQYIIAPNTTGKNGCPWPVDGLVQVPAVTVPTDGSPATATGANAITSFNTHNFYFTPKNNPLITDTFAASSDVAAYNASTSTYTSSSYVFTSETIVTLTCTMAQSGVNVVNLPANSTLLKAGDTVTGGSGVTVPSGTVIQSGVNEDGLAGTLILSNNITATSISSVPLTFTRKRYWQSLFTTGVAGNTPSTASNVWKEAFVYKTWSASLDRAFTAQGQFVSHPISVYNEDTGASANKVVIWKSLKDHSASSDRAPSINSSFWVRGDLCGKTLKSCQCRFAGLPFIKLDGSRNTQSNQPPIGKKEQATRLPFGAFPGTAKF